MPAPAERDKFERVEIRVDGEAVQARRGASLAAALLELRVLSRHATIPANREWAPLCAMGSCFGCCVRVDGRDQVRACLEAVRAGMEVDTDA